MATKVRIRTAALVTSIVTVLFVILYANPYYNPPLPTSIKWPDNNPFAKWGWMNSDDHIGELADEDEYYPSHSYENIEDGLAELESLNEQVLSRLETCMSEGTCGQNQTKVAILTGYWVLDTMVLGGRGGEGVWILSIAKALRQMGYSVLLTRDYSYAVELYNRVPDQIKVIAGFENHECTEDTRTCVKSEANPTGIPRWKLYVFDLEYYPWGGNDGRLGWEWVLHAERPGPSNPDHNNFHWMGYSLEDQCQRWRKVADSSVNAPNSAWFYSKQLTYAYSPFSEFAWNRSYFELASHDLAEHNLTFRGAYKNDPTFLPERIEGGVEMHPLPGIDNLGKIGPADFAQELANSKLLVGIGQPWLGPSPWVGLCLRTPFLNPLKSWNPDDPEDRSRWSTQHNALAGLEPPYVYHVRAGDYDGFVEAVQQAIENPMPDRYLDPEMTEAAMRGRVGLLMERDWETLAGERRAQLEGEGWAVDWIM